MIVSFPSKSLLLYSVFSALFFFFLFSSFFFLYLFLSPLLSIFRFPDHDAENPLLTALHTRQQHAESTIPPLFYSITPSSQAANHTHQPKLDLDPVHHLNCTILMPPLHLHHLCLYLPLPPLILTFLSLTHLFYFIRGLSRCGEVGVYCVFGSLFIYFSFANYQLLCV